MQLSHLTYAALLLLSGIVCLIVILIAWSRRYAPGAKALIAMMSGTAIWALTYAVYWLFPNDPAPFFWLDATYIGVAIAPTAFLIFAVQFYHQDQWLNKHTLWIFTLIPILTVIILWTDPYHNLFFAGKRLPSSTDIFAGGPWYWVNIVYSYMEILVGYGIVYRGYFRQQGIYRKQSLLILLGSVIAPLANLIGILNISPFPGLDITPISFTILGIFYTFGLLHLSIFDIIPVAKEILINTMQEGMVIIDQYDRLVEVNQTAINDLQLDRNSMVGRTVDEIFKYTPEFLNIWHQRDQIVNPFQIQFPYERTQSVNINRLVSGRPKLKGWLVSWTDVTNLIAAENRLKHANTQLAARLKQIESLQAVLQEQVIRDPLTGLLNRRYLDETIEKETARADRKQYEIILLMIDIDSFKTINDTYGHPSGDKVLKQLALVMLNASRKDDFVVRMGGEEFLILMSDVSAVTGLERAEAIRKAVEDHEFKDGTMIHHITISIGMAVYPQSSSSMDGVIKKADEALYRAKADGKNRVASE